MNRLKHGIQPSSRIKGFHSRHYFHLEVPRNEILHLGFPGPRAIFPMHHVVLNIPCLAENPPQKTSSSLSVQLRSSRLSFSPVSVRCLFLSISLPLSSISSNRPSWKLGIGQPLLVTLMDIHYSPGTDIQSYKTFKEVS